MPAGTPGGLGWIDSDSVGDRGRRRARGRGEEEEEEKEDGMEERVM